MLTKEQKEMFIQEIFCDKPEEAQATYTILAKLRNGEYDQNFVDMMMQKMDNDYDITDAFYFGKILASFAKGELFIGYVELGESPGKDNQVDKNNEKLKKLTHPFEANFSTSYGAGYNSDGIFKWKEEIVLRNYFGKTRTITEKEIPLETGYTNSDTTYCHLFVYNHALARWGYNQKGINIILRRDAF